MVALPLLPGQDLLIRISDSPHAGCGGSSRTQRGRSWYPFGSGFRVEGLGHVPLTG